MFEGLQGDIQIFQGNRNPLYAITFYGKRN